MRLNGPKKRFTTAPSGSEKKPNKFHAQVLACANFRRGLPALNREMAERSKAAVLKTVEVKASWGSNPYLPAIVALLNLRSKISFIAYAERAA